MLSCALCGALFRPLEWVPVYADELDDDEAARTPAHFSTDVNVMVDPEHAIITEEVEVCLKALTNGNGYKAGGRRADTIRHYHSSGWR
jgi:hypothetical protein